MMNSVLWRVREFAILGRSVPRSVFAALFLFATDRETHYGVAESERRESLKLVHVGSNPTSVANPCACGPIGRGG